MAEARRNATPEVCKEIDNGWNIATDAGALMDSISVKRSVGANVELIAAYDTVNDEPIFRVQDDADDDTGEELPF